MTSRAVPVPRLHVVTDDDVLARPDFVECARRVLAAGPDVALHLRGPGTGARRVWEIARALRPGPRPGPRGGRWEGRPQAAVLVNDRVDVACLVEAHGVHLGERSLPASVARTLLPAGSLLGVSVHGPRAAASAAEEGADYLMVGTIFPTPSHPGRAGAGPDLIHDIAEAGSPPLLAVGGVTPGRVAPCLRAGAHGVAVLRGVWDASDTERAVAGYVEALAVASGLG